MIITCPCGEKKFEVDTNLIPDKGRLLKCGSCDQTWFFDKNNNNKNKAIIDKPSTQKKILYEEKNINKSELDFSQKTSSELVKYKPKSNFTFGKFLGYIIVSIITFISIIIILDTFKDPLSIFFPNLELILYNLFETLRDMILFVKDLN